MGEAKVGEEIVDASVLAGHGHKGNDKMRAWAPRHWQHAERMLKADKSPQDKQEDGKEIQYLGTRGL